MRSRSASPAALDSESDFTELFRRNAFWLAPSLLLFHALCAYGFAPSLARLSLIATPLGFLGGLLLRRIRRARFILASAIGVFVFGLVYTPGVAAQLSYLALIKRTEWTLPVLVLSLPPLGWFNVASIRTALRIEWPEPLDKTAGVHLSMENGSLRREVIAWDQSGITKIAYVLLAIAVPSIYFTRGTPLYLTCVLFLFPYFIASLSSIAVARWIAFYIVVRRWELQHGRALSFLPLPTRK